MTASSDYLNRPTRSLAEVMREKMASEPSNAEIWAGSYEPIFENGRQIARRDMTGNVFDMMGRPIPAPKIKDCA